MRQQRVAAASDVCQSDLVRPFVVPLSPAFVGGMAISDLYLYASSAVECGVSGEAGRQNAPCRARAPGTQEGGGV